MKKLFLFFLSAFICIAFAKDNKYLNYTSSLIHYNFELKNFNKINVPFEKKIIIKGVQKVNTFSGLEKKINIKLISVFNKNAYILINEYLGNKLIKSYKKWVKKGDTFEKYFTVKKIELNKIILKYKNKIILKTLNKKIPGIKER